MTFTYASTDLSTDLAKIRRALGDVDSSEALLSDEEINSASSQTGSIQDAAALSAEWIAATFARKADKSVGPLSISLSQKYDHYMDLAARLRATSSMSTLPFAGGISISRKDAVDSDTDRVKPSFELGLLDSEMVSGTSST